MNWNGRVITMLILAFMLGFLVGSAIFIDKLEQNQFQEDRLINICNQYYGVQNWTLIKGDTGKYTCTELGNVTPKNTTFKWGMPTK